MTMTIKTKEKETIIGEWNQKFYGHKNDEEAYFFIDNKKIQVTDVVKMWFENDYDESDYIDNDIDYLPAVLNPNTDATMW